MAESKGYYAIVTTGDGFLPSLNFILAQIAGRLDAVEGLSGDIQFEGDLAFGMGRRTKYTRTGFAIYDADGTIIHQMGEV